MCQLFCQLSKKVAQKYVCQPVCGLPGGFLLRMDIGVHGGHDVRMAQHRLHGFGIRPCLEYCSQRMSDFFFRWVFPHHSSEGLAAGSLLNDNT